MQSGASRPRVFLRNNQAVRPKRRDPGAFSSITSAAAFLPGVVSAFGIIKMLWQ